MFGFSSVETRQRFTQFHLGVFFLCAALSQASLAQGDPEIVWQSNNGGKAVAFSADGQLLLSGTRLWTAADGTLIRTFVLPYNGGGVNTVALSPDGQYAAIGIQAFNQNLDLFQVADGALVRGRITAHSNGTTSVAFSPDGQLLASGGRDGTAKLWHLPDMTLVRTMGGSVGYGPRVFAVAFSHDGQTLFVGGQGGVQFFRVSDGTLIRDLAEASSTLSLAVSPDDQLLAAGSNAIDQYGQCTDCSIKIWRIADGALLQTIDGNNDGIITIAFSPDQQVIAAGSGDRLYDGVVRFWRVSDGVLLRFFNQDPNNVYSYVTGFAYSPDGTLFAFGRADARVVMARNPFVTCPSKLDQTSLAFSSSGGSGSVNIAMSGNCSWSATSNVSWITLTSEARGSGSGALKFDVTANSTDRARSGTVTIGEHTLTVTEDGPAFSLK